MNNFRDNIVTTVKDDITPGMTYLKAELKFGSTLAISNEEIVESNGDIVKELSEIQKDRIIRYINSDVIEYIEEMLNNIERNNPSVLHIKNDLNRLLDQLK